MLLLKEVGLILWDFNFACQDLTVDFQVFTLSLTNDYECIKALTNWLGIYMCG